MAQRRGFSLPDINLLLESEEFPYEQLAKKARVAATTLENAFEEFGLNVKVAEIDTGPVVTQFELELERGLRLNKITALEDDLAIALRVPSVRVVAPIPGKNTVGVEVPNDKQVVVRMRELLQTSRVDLGRDAIAAVPGQGRERSTVDRRYGEDAASADRRTHGHRKERVSEYAHSVAADDPDTGRSADADDRPENGRTQPVQEDSASDASGDHGHEEGGSRAGLGRR